MNEEIHISVLGKDPETALRELSPGTMVAGRSHNDFLYIFDAEGEYRVFSHTPGLPEGGRKSFSKDEKGTAIVKNLLDIAGALFAVEFGKGFNIYGVMYSAEEAILDMFPGADTNLDEDIDFFIPDREKNKQKGEGDIMAKIPNDPLELKSLVKKYLDVYQGEVICPLQLWYQGLSGMGVPTPEETKAMEDALSAVDGWENVGVLRYELYGNQLSFKRKGKMPKSEKIMVQHMFKKDSVYKAPDGRMYKVALAEVYNLRCFEVVDGRLVGGMIKINPTSELAQSLVEV